jgi:DNA/RNA endonuclease G (NUC1)
MKRIIFFNFLVAISSLIFAQEKVLPPGKGFMPILLNENYNHNKFGVTPSDVLYKFAAYTSSFDSDDDNNQDGESDLWCVPEWVAYEIHPKPDSMPSYNRPKWFTDDKLYAERKAPNDDTYKVSGTHEIKVVKTNNRFVRGHMCPKATADRLGKNAGYNTHTMLNAVPQLQWQNNGVWKFLEKDCNNWADKYEKVWVICGPAYFKKSPAMWLGQAGNVQAAIPDAIFKIVIRENKDHENGLEVLAFLFPNIIKSDRKKVYEFFTSISIIEQATGLVFLTNTELTNTQLKEVKNFGLDQNGKEVSQVEKESIFNKW